MGSGATKRALDNSLSALQRIERAENQIALLAEDRMKFIEAVNGAFAKQAEKVSTIEGVVNAIVEVLDKTTSNLVASQTLTINPGTVLATLKTHLAIRQAAQVERDKAAIAALVETGSLVATDTVTAESLIVGEESSASGSGPGWVQMEFSNVIPDFQPLLLGKKVGDSVQLGQHTLAVKEIFTIVPKAPAAPPADPAATDPAATYVAPAPFSEAAAPTAEVA
jgi:transcriptional regulator with GAF, ATPase, and Fis domain